MSKFCNNCGTQLDDGALFCSNCGTANQEAPQETPVVPEVPVAEAAPETPVVTEAPAQEPAPKAAKPAFNVDELVAKVTGFVGKYVEAAKADKKLIIVPAAAVVVLIALLILLSSLFSGSYKTPLDNAVKLLTGKGSEKRIESMLPKEAWEFLDDEADIAVDDVADLYDDHIDDLVDQMEDTFGKNFKVKYKITKKKDLSDNKVEKIGEALDDLFDIKASSVKKAYKLDLELEISGKEDDEEAELDDVIVAKIGGDWYIVGAMGFDPTDLTGLMDYIDFDDIDLDSIDSMF